LSASYLQNILANLDFPISRNFQNLFDKSQQAMSIAVIEKSKIIWIFEKGHDTRPFHEAEQLKSEVLYSCTFNRRQIILLIISF
jgi:hypothetical protein